MTPWTRRRLLTGTFALGTGAVLGACTWSESAGSESAGSASDGAQADPSDGDEGPWEFTDDRGETAQLDHRPNRIVAFVGAAAALWDYGVRPVGIVGPATRPDGSPDWQAGRVDVDEVTSLGNVWGEFNVEEYAALEPDLFVSVTYGDEFGLWYVPGESASEIESLAPTVGIRVSGVPLGEPLRSFERLARALGADTTSERVRADQERFQQATRDLADLVADKPGLRVLAASAEPEQFYVSVPDLHNPDLAYYDDQGVDIVMPDEPVTQDGFFKELSWENADAYPADVILYDARTQAVPPEELSDQPTWSGMPAVEAGQVLPWRTEAPFSYRQYADVLTELVDGLADAEPVT